MARPSSRPVRYCSLVITAAFVLMLPALTLAAIEDAGHPQTGAELYMKACANCHGADGRGAPPSQLAFAEQVPDFTDCDFAMREPSADWVGIAFEGGPTRGFSEMMPAFGEVLTEAELELVIAYVKDFCQDKRWPSGDLNLPRALYTEKAFVEDEAVFSVFVPTEGEGAVFTKVVYEQRFGPKSQFELIVPMGWQEKPGDDAGDGEGDDGGWTSAVGNIAVGLKHVLYHSKERGSIFSVAGEVIFPTGDADEGFGENTMAFEPFVSFGQVLPASFFLHAQTGAKLPLNTDKEDNGGFLRAVLGRTFTVGTWGRAWSPMVEILGSQKFVSGADSNWDVAPQIQVTLNTRQHVMLNIGVRTPLNNTEGRSTQIAAYLLWDWFDGGFSEGW